MFSIQIDSTQDVSVKDQMAIVIRYVTDKVYERVLVLSVCHSSTGIGIFELVKNELNQIGLDLSMCIGNATDGAANMQGEYNGFSAMLSQDAPNQIHVWCYAHILNLVLVDMSKLVLQSCTLFDTINKVKICLLSYYLNFTCILNFSHIQV